MKLEIEFNNSTSNEAHAITRSIQGLLVQHVLKPGKSIELYLGDENEEVADDEDDEEARRYNITICVEIEEVSK